MDNIRIIFILPTKYSNEDEATDIMLQTFEACKQHKVKEVKWEKEENFAVTDLKKTDFVVFEEFRGDTFEKIKDSSSRILGPWCLSICLMEGKPIPNFPWPIKNVALYNCVVACSNLSKETRSVIRDRVQEMGGCFTDSWHGDNTHLVTDSVKTDKYLCAAEAGAKIMVPEWIENVWQASKTANLHGDDEEFEKFRCLPFQNLRICTTGFRSEAERNHLEQLTYKNGGTFCGKLNTANTDVLIVAADLGGTNSAKYKAARKTGVIKCVTINWITGSDDKGYALPFNNYVVKKTTSTPTKDGDNPNFSVLSCIPGPSGINATTLEETVGASRIFSRIADGTPVTSNKKRKVFPYEEFSMIVKNIDIKKAKKAGHYLDGCSIYVAGVNAEHREKLCKIINLSGATRYDDISDRVTHVIVGDPQAPDVKLIRTNEYSCALVTIHWLIDSIEKQQAVCEENYLISAYADLERSDFGSPLCKKGLSLLRSNKIITEKDMQEIPIDTIQDQEKSDTQANDEDIEIMKKYLKAAKTALEEDTLEQLLNNEQNLDKRTIASSTQNGTPTEQTTCSVTANESTMENTYIFDGVKLIMCDFRDSEQVALIREQIEQYGGIIVSKTFKGVVDYIVAPTVIYNEIRHSSAEIVNDLFISECIQDGNLINIEYYHKPIVVPNETVRPLEKCVVTTSSYTGYERIFLKNIIESLGGISQEQFSRVTSVEKQIVASTHLITLEATGKKYMAALKWGLPVVDKNWLLECAQTGSFVAEKKYIIGDAKAPLREIQHNSPSKVTPPISIKSNTPQHKSNNNEAANQSNVTPKRIFFSQKDTTPVTPVSKIMQDVRNTNLLDTPPNTSKPACWMGIDTPETPLGAFIRPNPSPNLRKEMQRYLNQFPDFVPPRERRKSTPLAELKQRLLNKIGNNSFNQMDSQNNEANHSPEIYNDNYQNKMQENMEIEETRTQETAEQKLVNKKLQIMEDMLNSGNSSSRRNSRTFQPVALEQEFLPQPNKDSQANTVGWSYGKSQATQDDASSSMTRIFMISGVENEQRQLLVSQIESLGAMVSQLSNYDPASTHLICPKPARNEKTLSCMAAGKWILHTNYIQKSFEAGHFLNEEEYECGNPKSMGNITVHFDKDTEIRMQSIHWWRKEINRRGYKVFHDMRAIVVASNREPIIRVIEAGGGAVVDARPPFGDAVHATHCLLEPRSVSNFSAYIPLAKQGIFCINTLYISDYLHRTSKDIRDCILPYFTKYY